MNRLFVIGNGFDLHHKLNTGFNSFRKHLKENYPEYFEFINNLILEHNPSFNSDDWNHIEDELVCVTELDYDYMLDEAIASSETDMDKASYWNDIQFNAEYFNRDLPNFKKCFDSWIDNIDVKSYNADININFKKNDCFLNFNYTDTLQQLYGVDDLKVLHIHGKKGSEKVFGHNVYSEEPLPMSKLTQEDYDHGIEDDWRIEEAKAILNQIPVLFYKDSETLIGEHQAFFDSISSYDEIVFMGWALGEQDEVYMNQLLAKARSNVKYSVVYYSEDPTVKITYQTFFESYNVKKENVNYYTWEDVSEIFN